MYRPVARGRSLAFLCNCRLKASGTGGVFVFVTNTITNDGSFLIFFSP
jgi:hypothetical protein